MAVAFAVAQDPAATIRSRGGRLIPPRSLPEHDRMMTTIARASFTFPEFTGRSQLALHGSAAFWNGVLRLTPANPDTVGAAWYDEPVPVAGGCTTELRFILSGQGGDRDEIGATGGDGFAFVVRGLSSAAIGGKGA